MNINHPVRRAATSSKNQPMRWNFWDWLMGGADWG